MPRNMRMRSVTNEMNNTMEDVSLSDDFGDAVGGHSRQNSNKKSKSSKSRSKLSKLSN